MDQGWTECRDGWERLQWARRQKHETAKLAAEALGMNENTYRQYERKAGSSRHVPLDHQSAARFAKKFKVSYRWLLEGLGSPFDKDLSAAQKRVVNVMADKSAEDQEKIADAIERLFAS